MYDHSQDIVNKDSTQIIRHVYLRKTTGRPAYGAHLETVIEFVPEELVDEARRYVEWRDEGEGRLYYDHLDYRDTLAMTSLWAKEKELFPNVGNLLIERSPVVFRGQIGRSGSGNFDWLRISSEDVDRWVKEQEFGIYDLDTPPVHYRYFFLEVLEAHRLDILDIGPKETEILTPFFYDEDFNPLSNQGSEL